MDFSVEYNVSYVYHALYAYFDRDNVALKGLARLFSSSLLLSYLPLEMTFFIGLIFTVWLYSDFLRNQA